MIMSNKEKTKIEKMMLSAVCAILIFSLQSCQPDDWVKIYVPEEDEDNILEKNMAEVSAVQSDTSPVLFDSPGN